jgi:hypothetical protein
VEALIDALSERSADTSTWLISSMLAATRPFSPPNRESSF